MSTKEESVGLQVKIEVTHSEWFLFGDKVGIDISQINDGNVGGQKIVTEKGNVAVHPCTWGNWTNHKRHIPHPKQNTPQPRKTKPRLTTNTHHFNIQRNTKPNDHK